MSYEQSGPETPALGAMPFTRGLRRRRGAARGFTVRGSAMMPRNLVRRKERSAGGFYSGAGQRCCSNPGTPAFSSQVVTLDGLAFSLRRPRWLKKLKVGRILGKVAKVGAIVAGTALIGPAAAGLGLRAGFGLAKGARILTKLGGKAFSLGAGKRASRGFSSIFGKMRGAQAAKAQAVAEATAPESAQAQASAPVAASMFQGSDPTPAVMTSNGPMIPEPGDEPGDEPTKAGAGGGSPAVMIGALVVGGLLLMSMSRRKGRAA